MIKERQDCPTKRKKSNFQTLFLSRFFFPDRNIRPNTVTSIPLQNSSFKVSRIVDIHIIRRSIVKMFGRVVKTRKTEVNFFRNIHFFYILDLFCISIFPLIDSNVISLINLLSRTIKKMK